MAVDQSNHVASTHAGTAKIDIDAWRRRIKEETFSHYHLAMGEALRRDGAGDAAIEQFRAALAIAPGHALAYRRLVELLRDAGRIDEAKAVDQEAVSVNPCYQVDALHLEGRFLVEGGQTLAAIDRYREALQGGRNEDAVKRDLSDALRWRGVEIAGQGRDTEALPFLREAAGLNPTDETMVSLSDALYRLERSAEAIKTLRPVLAEKPLLAAAHYALGQHLIRRNDFAAASSMANAAVVDPMLASPYPFLSQFALCDGRLSDAVNWARRGALLDSSKAIAHFRLGVALLAAGRYSEAMEVNKEVRKIDPTGSYAAQQQVMILIAQGNDPQTAPLLDALSARAPDDVMVQGFKGHILFRLNRKKEAEAILQASVAGNPDAAWARLCLGWMLRRSDRAEEAAAHFRRAVELRGRWVLYEARLCPWMTEEALAAYRELGVS